MVVARAGDGVKRVLLLRNGWANRSNPACEFPQRLAIIPAARLERARSSSEPAPPRRAAAARHVELAEGRREMQRRARAVVLGKEVRVDLGKVVGRSRATTVTYY